MAPKVWCIAAILWAVGAGTASAQMAERTTRPSEPLPYYYQLPDVIYPPTYVRGTEPRVWFSSNDSKANHRHGAARQASDQINAPHIIQVEYDRGAFVSPPTSVHLTQFRRLHPEGHRQSNDSFGAALSPIMPVGTRFEAPITQENPPLKPWCQIGELLELVLRQTQFAPASLPVGERRIPVSTNGPQR
jgi:hypothetical protein